MVDQNARLIAAHEAWLQLGRKMQDVSEIAMSGDGDARLQLAELEPLLDAAYASYLDIANGVMMVKQG